MNEKSDRLVENDPSGRYNLFGKERYLQFHGSKTFTARQAGEEAILPCVKIPFSFSGSKFNLVVSFDSTKQRTHVTGKCGSVPFWVAYNCRLEDLTSVIPPNKFVNWSEDLVSTVWERTRLLEKKYLISMKDMCSLVAVVESFLGRPENTPVDFNLNRVNVFVSAFLKSLTDVHFFNSEKQTWFLSRRGPDSCVHAVIPLCVPFRTLSSMCMCLGRLPTEKEIAEAFPEATVAKSATVQTGHKKRETLAQELLEQ